MRTEKICNGTLEHYHAICWARLRLLNESDQVLSKCGTNQIKRRIVERKGQYARVDLRTKSFEPRHDTPLLLLSLLLSLLFLGLISPRPATRLTSHSALARINVCSFRRATMRTADG